VTLYAGFGTMSGQVPFDRADRVADAYVDLLALARLAEDLGFDSLWMSEHHGARDCHIPSPVVMLAAMAAVTERILLGTGIVIAPFQHPLRFAEDCAVVDQLSRGRLIIGVGGGWRQGEFDAFGIPRSERVSRTVELATICRSAWQQERFSFSGRHHHFEDVAVTPKPCGPLPLVLGGSVPAAAGRAGRIADGFLAGPQSDLDAFRALVEAFDESATRSGRDPRQLFLGFEAITWVSEDGTVPDVVWDAIWHKLGASLQLHANGQVAEQADLPTIDRELLQRRAFVGAPADIVDQFRPWVEAFPDRQLHVLFRMLQPGLSVELLEPAMRLMTTEVIPRLKQIHG
jgi:probable F420-dependent oxidoreductase